MDAVTQETMLRRRLREEGLSDVGSEVLLAEFRARQAEELAAEMTARARGEVRAVVEELGVLPAEYVRLAQDFSYVLAEFL